MPNNQRVMIRKRNNHINLRDVSRDCPASMEVFISYYTGRFASDLRRFFDISNDFGDRSYPFVLEMPCSVTNLRRKSMVWDDLNHYYMFSAAVFYMSMCTQIVGRLYGWHQMENFMRASQWPMLSCGMGGLMHPIQVMWESELNPLTPDDSYTETLLNAGKYLKKDFLDFMKKGEPCLNRSAHNALVDTVDINELSALFDQQQMLYCEWIKNPETKYEGNYVAYPMDHIEKVPMHEYLKEFREDVPQWLTDYQPGDKVSFDEFMRCRVGYYPGAEFDGNLVKIGNMSHSVHCFLHADYGVSREEMEKHLAKDGCLADYHSIGKVDWSDAVHIDGHPGFRKLKPYCFMEVFERNADKDDSWGAERLAVTFLLADGINAYEQLFVSQYKKSPWIFLLQDHGFGGNYDRFGRGGALDRIMQKVEEKPEFVICGVNTDVWGGYFRINRVLATCGGMHRTTRHLYTNNCMNR